MDMMLRLLEEKGSSVRQVLQLTMRLEAGTIGPNLLKRAKPGESNVSLPVPEEKLASPEIYRQCMISKILAVTWPPKR